MNLFSFPISRTNYAIDLISARMHDFKIMETIVISGTPRSGSTWLMEILESLPDYKSVFEPFHPNWYPEFRKLGIHYDPYIPTPEDYPKLREYLGRVFTGKAYGMFPYKHYLAPGRVLKRLTANKLLVKFVRANTMLPWVANTFDLRAVYFIIRHPCATIASQLVTGYFSRITKEQFLDEVRKVSELAGSEWLMDKLSGISSQIELLAAIWAFENYIPLASERPYPWYTVIYERLITDPEEELDSIFGYINEDVPEGARKRLRTPSKVTRKTYGKTYIGTPKQLIKWREKLTERQIDAILEVVSWFGMDFYGNEPEPDYDALKNWRPPF
ncbi:sulfotransferase [Thermococcus sp. CX2]|uniref:sulfotransferase n=1 Tax=Thermococcus sp. CX2 TaxID=163006 RepID=UPI00143C82F4|nr:sulfotransferase [Thermococcus sp. CX2]NJE85498.1 sulfotransferase [Thermococcus sp. CX2]